MTLVIPRTGTSQADKQACVGERGGGELSVQSDIHVCACVSCVCVFSLDVLADLPLEAMPAFLQLFDGAFLREHVGSASHLCLRHAACEQLLKHRIIYHCVVKTGSNDKH